MSEGFKTTLECLAATQNEAAVRVLVPALDSPHRSIRLWALTSLVKRRSPIGHREVLRRLHTLDDSFKDLVANSQGRINQALRDALLGQGPAVGGQRLPGGPLVPRVRPDPQLDRRAGESDRDDYAAGRPDASGTDRTVVRRACLAAGGRPPPRSPDPPPPRGRRPGAIGHPLRQAQAAADRRGLPVAGQSRQRDFETDPLGAASSGLRGAGRHAGQEPGGRGDAAVVELSRRSPCPVGDDLRGLAADGSEICPPPAQ